MLLADDHKLFLEGLRLMLGSEFEITGCASDGRTLIEMACRLRPDLILVDISMPVLNGVEAMRQIRQEFTTSRFIVVSQHDGRHYVEAAFLSGASGYVVKQSPGSELRTAIHEVLAGRYYIDSSVAGKAGVESHACPTRMFGSSLTQRQREVLQLVAEGKSAKEMARILNISPKTVEFHKASLMDHVGLRTTAELTRYAIEQSIVSR